MTTKPLQRGCVLSAILLFSLCALLAASRAVTAADKPLAAGAQKQPVEPNRSEQPKPPGRSIEPRAATPGVDSNPVERILAGMRDAQRRMEEHNTGRETRDIQEQVVRDLDRLIELAKQQQSARSSSSQQKQEKTQQATDADSKNQPQQTDGQPLAGQKNRPGDAQSQDRKTSPGEKNARFDLRAMSGEVWGHLPEKVRQRLSNTEGESALPKYAELVKQYFEALAEQRPGDKSK